MKAKTKTEYVTYERMFKLDKEKVNTLENDINNMIYMVLHVGNQAASDAKALKRVTYEFLNNGFEENEIAYVFYRVGELLAKNTPCEGNCYKHCGTK